MTNFEIGDKVRVVNHPQLAMDASGVVVEEPAGPQSSVYRVRLTSYGAIIEVSEAFLERQNPEDGVLSDLQDRLMRAMKALTDMSDEAEKEERFDEYNRLRAKREGVSLALSYVDEVAQ